MNMNKRFQNLDSEYRSQVEMGDFEGDQTWIMWEAELDVRDPTFSAISSLYRECMEMVIKND